MQQDTLRVFEENCYTIEYGLSQPLVKSADGPLLIMNGDDAAMLEAGDDDAEWIGLE